MKIEIFKKQKNFRKGGFHTNPNISWEITLSAAFVVTIAFCIFGFYLFLQTNQESVSSTMETLEQIETVKKGRIDQALEYFSDREKQSTLILQNPSGLVDPSL